jgi:hypothetical protein
VELVSAYVAARARREGTLGSPGTGKCRACGVRICGTGVKYDGMWFHTTWGECENPLFDQADAAPLTILRGVADTGDACTYFHSTVSVSYFTQKAVERGWLTGEPGSLVVTDAGAAALEMSGIKNFPKGYHQFWPWRTARAVPPQDADR